MFPSNNYIGNPHENNFSNTHPSAWYEAYIMHETVKYGNF